MGNSPSTSSSSSSSPSSSSSSSSPSPSLSSSTSSLITSERKIVKEFIEKEGNKVAAYKVEKLFGYGDNGAVFEVSCIVSGSPSWQSRYALKFCYNMGLSSDSVKNMFNRESQILQHLNHPNIVCYFAQFQDRVPLDMLSPIPPIFQNLCSIQTRGQPLRGRTTQFFVFEYHSINLSDYLEAHYPLSSECLLPFDMVISILTQIGNGLKYLERNSICHRDIKLNNILVSLSAESTDSNSKPKIERCVIADFGNAISFSRRDMKETVTVSNQNMGNWKPWGNQVHIAPELLSIMYRGLKSSSPIEITLDYSKQSIFELGVLAYEMIVGHEPILEYPSMFKSQDDETISYQESDIVSIPEIYPVSFRQLLQRCVLCDAAQRISLSDFLSQLNNLTLGYTQNMGSEGSYTRIQHLEQSLASLQQIHGDIAHRDIAMSLINLGLAYSKLGEYSRSIEYHQQSLNMLKQIYGNDASHPDIARSLNNLGSAYSKLGEYSRSIEYHQQSLNMRKQIYGNDTSHPSIALSLGSLGNAHVEAGNVETGIEHLEKSVEMHLKTVGPDHPHTKLFKRRLEYAKGKR